LRSLSNSCEFRLRLLPAQRQPSSPHFDAIAIGHALALVLEVVVIAVVLNAEVSAAPVLLLLLLALLAHQQEAAN
jgi:hypothetical protein